MVMELVAADLFIVKIAILQLKFLWGLSSILNFPHYYSFKR